MGSTFQNLKQLAGVHAVNMFVCSFGANVLVLTYVSVFRFQLHLQTENVDKHVLIHTDRNIMCNKTKCIDGKLSFGS